MSQIPYPPASGPPPQPPPQRRMLVWAIVLIAVGGCGIFSVIILAAVSYLAVALFPVFVNARDAALQARCQTNMQALSTALQMYAEDHDGRFPPADQWQSAIQPYLGADPGSNFFVCPNRMETDPGYAFNPVLSGRAPARNADPETTVLLFEASHGPLPGSGAPEGFATPHRNRGYVAFLDGDVRLSDALPSAPAGK